MNNNFNEEVFIYDVKNTNYPEIKPFHPSKKYPEYPFGSKFLSKQNNNVYEGIRELFHLMNLDNGNYNTSKWNPLKGTIKPGDNVLLKPNMVLNGDNQDALTTHGSIIRAVVDYVYMALEGQGTIVIADAPIQSCDFSEVVKITGIDEIVKFYKLEKGFEIKVIDFRQECISKVNQVYIQNETKLAGDPLGYSLIDLGINSCFKNIDSSKEFIVTNYNPKEIKKYHNKEHHQYLIPNTVLKADVVINLPKPKTHRKAGVTAALKNIIGISGNKAGLPHHTRGAAEKKGDEYLYHNPFRKLSSKLIILRDSTSRKNHMFIAKIFNVLREINDRSFVKLFKADIYSEGSWWGNDTIWRTIDDLNTIIRYVNKKGIMQTSIQRKVISIADMIISGEKEGPLHPSPKSIGILVASFNSLIMDTVIATIMGFDFKKIPSIYKGYDVKGLNSVKVGNIKIVSNNKKYLKPIESFKYDETFKFVPTKGWENHIEIN